MYINKQLKMYSHTQETVRLSNSQYSLYHVYVIGMVLGNKMLKQSINEFEITLKKNQFKAPQLWCYIDDDPAGGGRGQEYSPSDPHLHASKWLMRGGTGR